MATAEEIAESAAGIRRRVSVTPSVIHASRDVPIREFCVSRLNSAINDVGVDAASRRRPGVGLRTHLRYRRPLIDPVQVPMRVVAVILHRVRWMSNLVLFDPRDSWVISQAGNCCRREVNTEPANATREDCDQPSTVMKGQLVSCRHNVLAADSIVLENDDVPTGYGIASLE